MKKLLYCSVIASLLSIALFVAAAPAIGFNVVAIPSVEGPIPITEESQAFVPADCSV